jgi:hypothetical protein
MPENTFSPNDLFGGDVAGQMGDVQFEDWQAIKEKLGKEEAEGFTDDQMDESSRDSETGSTHDEL